MSANCCQAHRPVGAEVDHDDRPEAAFGFQLLHQRNPGVPLAADGRFDIYAGNVGFQGGLCVEHHRVADGGDMAGEEALARSRKSHRSRDRRSSQ